jgi:uncharacterized protein YkwD
MTRARTFLVLGVLLAFLAATMATPAAAGTYRGEMFSLINKARSNHGVHKVKLNIDLSQAARHHSRRMADLGYVFHTPNIAGKLKDVSWSISGETIAMAHKLKRVRKLWMKSPAHRDILLNNKFDWVGVGVVHQGGWFWVTAIFYG